MLMFLMMTGDYDPTYGRPKPIKINLKDLADLPAAWKKLEGMQDGQSEE